MADEAGTPGARREDVGNCTEPSISGRRNLGTIRMIEAAIRSSESGRRVLLAEVE
jgi:hypothetical protein